ncbi:MAG TPA: tryptophan synthase subunit beta [Pirellulaceae bacterium]|nr:tryptophan synthase subunit beta [Pirellulaceae bacterium]HMO93346.1 tryptophan synthase subunit beta [Pirellulaceae bacterium]HMP70117.1 tryptophan synthase subunit beta [Pirellulaceae bacterium]
MPTYFDEALPIARVPNERGRFGKFGGRYVPETLVPALIELEQEYEAARVDHSFRSELISLLQDFVGRPTPLYWAKNLTRMAGGAEIWFKREDLNHTGAHKINNTMGQALLTKRMGKRRVIAETGAGQHGVATATACSHFGLECVVYMGTEDIRRQGPNVRSMKLLGAEVRGVESGSRTLRDAINEAMRDWMCSVDSTHYLLGSVVGPHPFPRMVRDFQAVIGEETLTQCRVRWNALPDLVIACVGGGSNAAGMFYPFVAHTDVEIIGVEAGGLGVGDGEHAAPLNYGVDGILHGSLSRVLQSADGQTLDVHSASAGLDYPGVGPEHSYWHETKRVRYVSCHDLGALNALLSVAKAEGIIPALESAHAIAVALHEAKSRAKEQRIVVCLSGRGEKDAAEVERLVQINSL